MSCERCNSVRIELWRAGAAIRAALALAVMGGLWAARLDAPLALAGSLVAVAAAWPRHRHRRAPTTMTIVYDLDTGRARGALDGGRPGPARIAAEGLGWVRVRLAGGGPPQVVYRALAGRRVRRHLRLWAAAAGQDGS